MFFKKIKNNLSSLAGQAVDLYIYCGLARRSLLSKSDPYRMAERKAEMHKHAADFKYRAVSIFLMRLLEQDMENVKKVNRKFGREFSFDDLPSLSRKYLYAFAKVEWASENMDAASFVYSCNKRKRININEIKDFYSKFGLINAKDIIINVSMQQADRVKNIIGKYSSNTGNLWHEEDVKYCLFNIEKSLNENIADTYSRAIVTTGGALSMAVKALKSDSGLMSLAIKKI